MRKYYLDNIRWLTVLCVVVYHVFYMYNASGVLGGCGPITDQATQYQDLVMYILYPWLMPLLFLVSGACARLELDRRSAGDFIRRRTVRLLVPATVGLFVFQFIQGYISMSLGGAFATMTGVPGPIKYLIMALSGIGVLWYIQLLWLLSLVLLLIRKLERDRLWRLGGRAGLVAFLLLTVPVWAAAQILNTPVIIVYRCGLYGVVFLLGYFVFSHDAVIERLKRWFPLLAGIAVVLGVLFCLRYFGANFADRPVNRTPLFIAYGWLAALALLGGMAKYGDVTNRCCQWLSRRSFGLYVFHYLGISAVALFCGKTGLLPAWAVYLLSAAAGFGGGYLLNAVVSRIPLLRWAVLGIKKEASPHVQE